MDPHPVAESKDSFVQELRRRLRLQEKAAEKEQKNTKPFRAEIHWRSKGVYAIDAKVAINCKVGNRLKVGLSRDTSADDLHPKWGTLRVTEVIRFGCVVKRDLRNSFLESSSVFLDTPLGQRR